MSERSSHRPHRLAAIEEILQGEATGYRTYSLDSAAIMPGAPTLDYTGNPFHGQKAVHVGGLFVPSEWCGIPKEMGPLGLELGLWQGAEFSFQGQLVDPNSFLAGILAPQIPGVLRYTGGLHKCDWSWVESVLALDGRINGAPIAVYALSASLQDPSCATFASIILHSKIPLELAQREIAYILGIYPHGN